MTTTKVKKPSLVHVDPNELVVHPDNVRRDLGDLRALVRSVRHFGVLVPLVVVPTNEGDYLVIAGERRRAAAIAAECPSVACVVRHDLAGQADQIAAMVAENVHRQGLSSAEEAAAYEQLALLGLSDRQIAEATGVTRPHVAKARRVAGSEVATAVADRYDLTLDQALVLVEFEDDKEAIKVLTVTARKDPGQFEHVASRLRQDRERVEQRAATAEALTAAGVTILDSYDVGKAKALRDLTDGSGGAPIEPEAHAACPGRAATIRDWDPTQVTHYCLDPSRYGHADRYRRSGRPVGTPMSDDEKAKRREVVENNQAWRAAKPVRRQHIRDVLARKTVPKGTLRFVAEEILGHPNRVGDGGEEVFAELLGAKAQPGAPRVGPAHVATLSDARLPLALLAQVAADREQRMDVHTWKNPTSVDARWLTFLASTGYDLAPIEQHVVDTVSQREVVIAGRDAKDAAAGEHRDGVDAGPDDQDVKVVDQDLDVDE